MAEIYKDKNAPVDKRVKDLISQMTLREKFAQMFLTADTDYIDEMAKNGTYPEENIGGMWGETLSPEQVNKIQTMAKNTRLGIPPIIAYESLHGLMKDGSTIFPQSIGIGASFNTELTEEMAKVIGLESYIMGIRQTFAPNLDISRDPRWGRVEENYGEDPYLTSRMGVAYVKGLQSQKVAATLKHYIAHGVPEGGINLSPVHMGEREMREITAEPFEACCKEAGALSCMPAYSELDGIPVHASRFLLTDLLRNEMEFDGYTISDFGATGMLNFFHKVAEDGVAAGKLALNAGLDMEAPLKYAYSDEFLEEIKNDKDFVEKIDEAVRRILSVKFRLGLFDDPTAKPERINEIRTENSLELSRKIARETIVLLKNENSILPLTNDKKVLLVGPASDTAQTGDYSPMNADKYIVSLKDALSERLGDNLHFVKGCLTGKELEGEIENAVKEAQNVDVIIAAMGDNSRFFGGIGWGQENGDDTVTSGEGFDVSDLQLHPCQKSLLEELYKTGKPIILVIMSGRPYAITRECEISKAVLQAWYPGDMGGYAVADILYGVEAPSGKLPISFPRSSGHIPCYYNHKPSARGYYNRPGTLTRSGRDYVFDSPEPLFPFGFGLSYTNFEYSDLKCTKTGNHDVEVSVKVKNTGDIPAKETVLVYVSQLFCPTTPFVKKLRCFNKSLYEPHEEKTIKFTLSSEDFIYIDKNMKKAIGKGKMNITVANLVCEVDL